MTKHELTGYDIRHVKARFEYDGDQLREDKILDTNRMDHSQLRFDCSCGEEDMTLTEAEGHIESPYKDGLNARKVEETFEKVYLGKPIVTGEWDGDFIKRIGRAYYVGIEQEDGSYAVVKMWQETERIGRNEPRIKESDNTHAKMELHHVKRDFDPDDVANCVSRGTKLDDASRGVYRVSDDYEELLETYFDGYNPKGKL